jgi:hypothetical protein
LTLCPFHGQPRSEQAKLKFDLACTEIKKERRYASMNYTKPLILKTENAAFVIQQVNQSGSTGKNPVSSLDRDNFICSPAAYEADE